MLTDMDAGTLLATLGSIERQLGRIAKCLEDALAEHDAAPEGYDYVMRQDGVRSEGDPPYVALATLEGREVTVGLYAATATAAVYMLRTGLPDAKVHKLEGPDAAGAQ